MSNEKLSAPSEEFWDAVISRNSNGETCGFCERVHFVDDPSSDYEEGEFEELNKGHKENPDKFILHGGSVHWGYLDEKQAVYGCPCNEVSRYEKLFWEHRGIIADYFQRRAEKLKKFSEETGSLADKVKKSI